MHQCVDGARQVDSKELHDTCHETTDVVIRLLETIDDVSHDFDKACKQLDDDADCRRKYGTENVGEEF